MRVLVTGAAGLVGSRVCRAAAERGHEVHGAFHASRLEGVPCAWHALDRGQEAQAREVVAHVAPEVIVDCASWTDVDGCEADPARAERDNAQGAAHVAEAAARAGARVVHVGTDFVFDGAKQGPYVEGDEPRPQGVYARTKLAGERAVLAHEGNAVVRSGVIYGWHPRKLTFPPWVVRELRAGKEIRVVEGQRGTPTLAESLAEALVEAAERGAAGVFHAAGRDCVTRLGLARATARAFGLEESLVVPIPESELRQRAPRPAQACLGSSRAARELGYAPLPLAEALARLRQSEPEAPMFS